MKTTIKITALAIATLLMAQPLLAQPTGKPKQEHKMHQQRRGNNMSDLQLSDAQKQSLTKGKKEFEQKRSDLMKQENITVKQQRDQLFALRKQQQQAFQNILTPEQKTKWEAHQQMAKKGEGVPHQQMAEKLKLTTEQQTQLKALHQQEENKRLAMRNAATRTEFETARKQLMESRKDSLKKILSEEQMQQMKAMHQQHGRKKHHRSHPQPHQGKPENT